MSKWTRSLPWAWLVFIGTIAILSYYLPASRFTATTSTPTITYSGSLNVRVQGDLHVVSVQQICESLVCGGPQTVYYFMNETRRIRLDFGCDSPPCTLFGDVHLDPSVRLVEGAHVIVVGTLIVPSLWNCADFEPRVCFDADLYVIDVLPG